MFFTCICISYQKEWLVIRQSSSNYFLLFYMCIFVHKYYASTDNSTILDIPDNRIEYITGYSLRLPQESKQNIKIYFKNDWFDFFVNLQLYRYCNNLYFYSSEIYKQAKKYLVQKGKIRGHEEINIKMVHSDRSYILPKDFYFACVSMPIIKTWIIQNRDTSQTIFGEVNF